MAKADPRTPRIGPPGNFSAFNGAAHDYPSSEELNPLGDEDSDDGTGMTVTDTEDGGAVATLAGPPETDSKEFYKNLAADMEEGELATLATDLERKIQDDKTSRSKRDELYEEGIRRTGLAGDAPGGAQFEGASKVVHPMLIKASVDFGSRAVKELLPAKGPVRDNIFGTQTLQRVEKARRQTRHMNWQLTKQMPEFRSEMEQLITQLPLGGNCYMMLEWSRQYKRPIATFIPVDEMLIPFAASNFRSAQRRSWMEKITKETFEGRINDGLYRDADNILLSPSAEPDSTKSSDAAARVEGKETTAENIDGQRIVYRTWTSLKLEVDGDESHPYVVHLDDTTRKILAIYRNWKEEDENKEELAWVTEFAFVPWRGALAIGLVHLIGSLAAASTGALRALLDSAHLNNFPTMVKLAGLNKGGQTINLQATQVKEMEGGVSVDDIRKLMMNVPFNQPSPVLYELLGFCVEAGQDVVRTTFENMADNSQQMPVGTTLALIEQGMTVFSAIHARLHASMAELLSVLHRINGLYLNEQKVLDETGELLVKASDYQGPMDIQPVSDPNIFSETQRFAQVQIIAQRAQLMPQLYDAYKVEKAILGRTKIPDADQFLIPKPEVVETNAVTENAMLALGRPIHAFPDQDHLAHIQTLLDFAKNPMLGMLSIIAPAFVPAALQHLKEHIVFWYVDFMEKHASGSIRQIESGTKIADIMRYKDAETRKELDRLMAQVSAKFLERQTQQTLAGIMPVFQKLEQFMQQQQQAQMEQAAAAAQPMAQARITAAKIAAASTDKRTDSQTQVAQGQQKLEAGAMAADNTLKNQELQAQTEKEQADAAAEAERTRQQMIADAGGDQADRESQETQQLRELAAKHEITGQDNATALTIAEIAAAARRATAVKNGTRVNKE